jgi:hypothetical protein
MHLSVIENESARPLSSKVSRAISTGATTNKNRYPSPSFESGPDFPRQLGTGDRDLALIMESGSHGEPELYYLSPTHGGGAGRTIARRSR